MISDRKLANAVGGKTARACDSCISNRARWYCVPDDAFLCQACDASVHSVNPLARMHKRARLKIASFRSEVEATVEKFEPSWYHGFTRKARTPRHGKHHKPKSVEPTGNPTHLVPEMGNEENFHEDNEQQLLYSVPLCDDQHVVADMDASIDLNEVGTRVVSESVVNDCGGQDMNTLHGFLASEMDLEEFAAPVEIFLDKGLDEQPSFVMEGLGLLDNKEKNSGEDSLGSTERVKVGEEVAAAMNNTSCKESFELNLNYELFPHRTGDEQLRMKNSDEYCPVGDVMKKKISLSLDYEGVIAAWADVRSPWTTAERPELDPNNCLPDCKIGGNCGSFDHLYRGVGRQILMVDSGREAKVSRYREKRRTRFFSKKIRYEVRKLNAEKRPRIKGRFVKRTNNFAAATAFRLLHNNRQPLQTSHVH